MSKLIILLAFLGLFAINLFAQDIDPEVQAKIDEYQQFVDKYKAEDNTGSAVNYLIKIGNLYWQANDADKAIVAYNEAEILLQGSSNTTAKVQLSNSLGYLYMGQGNYVNAEKYFTDAYNISRDYANSTSLISSLLNIAQCQQNQNKFEDAISSYNEALTIALEIDDMNLAVKSSSKIALCYQQLGDTQNYTYYYNLSVKFDKELKDEIIQQKQDEVNRQSNLARQSAMLLQMQQYKNKMMKDSLSLQQQLNEQNEARIELLNKQQELRDSLIFQQEKELTNEKKLNKAQNRVISLLIFGIVIFIIAFLLIFRLYVLNKKQKEKLNQLNGELNVLNTNLNNLNIELSDKNEKIEKQSVILLKQKENLESQNKKISDSINYASRIQQAILPVKVAIEENFKGAFIFYRPRDVVSGDFYWFVKTKKEKIIAAVDCTGHSVPGAFMSMIANTLLNEIIKAKGETRLNVVLTLLNQGVIETLHSSKNVEGVNDGMDITLLKFEDGSRKAKFASANHVSVVFVEGERSTINGDFYSIGGMEDDYNVEFTEQEIDLGKEATIYMFSDGFVDQFNKKGKKYMSKRFFSFLDDVQQKSMHEQEISFSNEFDAWKQDFRQVDDVLVIGLKV
ncbi:MAG: SpoIIE family protein phosphatase [Bacteroidales bacterium]|nr:SpoIIE family protein phosphatase [Bacteroidales bacterium]